MYLVFIQFIINYFDPFKNVRSDRPFLNSMTD